MYQLNYDNRTGKVSSIKCLSDSASIPLAEGNTDYQAFLVWNGKQVTPLDLNSVNQAIKDAYEAEKIAREAAQAAKIQAMVDNLPSWAIVDQAVTDIFDLPSAKAFIRKLARIVYWLARDQQD